MKLKKKNYNKLYLNLLATKLFKLHLTEFNFQILKFQYLEIQLKKLIKLSFEIFICNKYLTNSLFFNLLVVFNFKRFTSKKRLLNFDFIQFCLKKEAFNRKLKLFLLKARILKFDCFASIVFSKKFNNKFKKIYSDLTNILSLSRDFGFLKKKKNFYQYNYLLFRDFLDLNFFFFFQNILLKVIKNLSVKKSR